MPRYDGSALKPIPDSAAKIGPRALDADLLELAQNYKNFVAKRYHLLRTEDIKTRIHDQEVYASTKLDGQFSYVIKDKGEIFLFNYSGRVVTGLPVFEDVAKALSNVDSAILACELYLPDDTGRSRVYAVTGALGEGGDALKRLKIAVFDILELNGESQQDLPFEDVHKLLEMHIPADGPFHRVDNRKIKSDDVAAFFNDVVREKGHEGVVARSVDHSVYKIKPRHSIDAVIIGFTQQLDNPKAVSALLTALMRPDGTFQVFSRVGSGLNDDERARLYETLRPLEVESLYNETDGNHTLFTMVKPVIVIQMAFLDILTERGNARPVMKAVLDLQDDAYHVMMPEPFVNLISPVFERVRDDKEVNPTDLRLFQLQPYVDLANLEASARQPNLTRSELLRREVFVKETKGVLSVRKFISWKTNKDEVDDLYPGYVFCFVDYSPTRKKPLARNVRITNSKDRVDEIFNSYLENEVKRGWKSCEEWQAAAG